MHCTAIQHAHHPSHTHTHKHVHKTHTHTHTHTHNHRVHHSFTNLSGIHDIPMSRLPLRSSLQLVSLKVSGVTGPSHRRRAGGRGTSFHRRSIVDKQPLSHRGLSATLWHILDVLLFHACKNIDVSPEPAALQREGV